MRKNVKKVSNKSGNGRPGKGYSNKKAFRKDKFDEERGVSGERAPRNDPKWYSKNPQMLYDSANLSYFNPVGEDLPWEDLAGYTNSSNNNLRLTSVVSDKSQQARSLVGAIASSTYTIPGVMGIYFMPTFGVSTSKSSPVNAAALDNYSFLRDKNSGAKNIEASDTFMYYLAADSLYMIWNWAKRIYGYARTYSNNNWYLPEGFAAIDQIDLSSFTANLSDLRGYLNYAAGRIAAFAIPAKYSLMTRHSWLVSNIWADSEQPKAQFYMYKPSYYWKYDWINNQLVPEPINVTTFSDLKQLMDDMITNMYSIDDVGIMSGDTQKAYGNDIYTLSAVTPDYAVVPTFNRDVLLQIHNSHFVNIESLTDANITQDPTSRAIVWNPTIGTTTTYFPKQVILNSPNWDVKPEENIEITRNITMLSFKSYDSSSDLVNVEISTCGSEVFLQMAMAVFTRDSSGRKLVVRDVHQVIYDFEYGYGDTNQYRDWVATLNNQQAVNNWLNQSGNNWQLVTALLSQVAREQVSTSANSLTMRALYSQFDWAPLQILLAHQLSFGLNTQHNVTDNSRLVSVYRGYIGDLANYTCVDVDRVKNMHLAALMSELDVPYSGNF